MLRETEIQTSLLITINDHKATKKKKKIQIRDYCLIVHQVVAVAVADVVILRHLTSS